MSVLNKILKVNEETSPHPYLHQLPMEHVEGVNKMHQHLISKGYKYSDVGFVSNTSHYAGDPYKFHNAQSVTVYHSPRDKLEIRSTHSASRSHKSVEDAMKDI